MKKNKLKLAGLAMLLGIVSSAVFARPTCADMQEMCAEGNAIWCYMFNNDPSCL
jgi:hypothetical protein